MLLALQVEHGGGGENSVAPAVQRSGHGHKAGDSYWGALV
jgi:hypothetical protein